MIIWYSANFMPVVKKQSHLCVTSIIITSGLFITMNNNEHQLCLWQCSQFHKLILCGLSYEAQHCWQQCCCVIGSNPGSSVKTISIPWSDKVSVFIVQPSPRCWAWPRVTCPPRVGPHVTTLTIATSNIPPTRSGPGVRSGRGPSTPTSITSTVHSHIMVHLSEQMIK